MASATEDESLGTLVGHFVDSKQSLAAASHVHRASDIVSAARSLLEDVASVTAKDRFLRSSIAQQLSILRTARTGLDAVSRDATAQFQALIKRMDAAHAQVKAATTDLRDTRVEPCFRPEGEQPRSLHSFVDENAVDMLSARFRACLDDFEAAHAELRRSNTAFDAEIHDLEESLKDADADGGSSDEEDSSDGSDGDSPAALFRSLEAHATELAELLQSLVKHYDLCITALKHTEGGAPAAQAALPSTSTDGASDHENAAAQLDPSLLSGPAAPLSPSERADLLAVLAVDAREVGPVVREMTARAADMETTLVRLSARRDAAGASHSRAASAVSALDSLGGRLPVYTHAATSFASKAAEVRERAGEGLAELDGLREFFVAFRRAYDGLLLEVGRRLQTRRRMDRIAADARAAIERLYEAERAERDVFQADCGEFLPADLWPGFVEPPTRYQIEVVNDGTRDIPVVPDDVLEEVRRQRARASR